MNRKGPNRGLRQKAGEKAVKIMLTPEARDFIRQNDAEITLGVLSVGG